MQRERERERLEFLTDLRDSIGFLRNPCVTDVVLFHGSLLLLLMMRMIANVTDELAVEL